MIGILFVFGLLAISCVVALLRPVYGIISFYGFVMLDPTWNWRWSLPPDVQYQKYIFVCVAIGVAINGFRGMRQSALGMKCSFALLGFLAIAFVSSMQSIAPETSDYFLGVIWKIIAVAIMTVFLIRTPRELAGLLVVIVLAQAYNSFQINLDYFSTGFSAYAHRNWGSTGADNNGYSIMTVPLLSASMSMAFCFVSRWRYLMFAIAILQMHQIMLMESRGCMIASIAMIALIVLYIPRSSGNTSILVCAFVMATALAGPSVINEFSSSFASGDNRDTSAGSRFKLWQAGVKITLDYPLLGVGPNAARYLVPLPEYYEGGVNMEQKALHNLVFDVTTGVGIPGAIPYFAFLLLPAVYCFRTYVRGTGILCMVRLTVFTGTVGYLIASMFSSGVLFEIGYVLPAAGLCCANLDNESLAYEFSIEATPSIQDE